MRFPSYYLCHGGGPWPWMQGPLREMLRGLEQGLLALPQQWPARPAAILVVSSHWQQAAFTVTASPAPGMVYDYQGFPEALYRIRYPSPGAPGLAARVVKLLQDAGCDARASLSQGYDHSTYSLLQPMVPEADIPVVQMSLQAPLDAAAHLRAGAALASLRDEGVLIIGSGMSCHGRGPEMAVASPAFDAWLRDTLQMADHTARQHALRDWEAAPHARAVHPQEDHLLPLMVAVGAAAHEPAHCIYRERLMGYVAVSSYRFGA